MKVPITEVADAVDSYFKGMSIPQIRENLFQQYNDRPSVASIFGWLTRFSKIAVDEASKHEPKLGETWQADEMVVRVAGMKGDKGWLWDCMDEKSRYLIASRLSPTRSGRDAEALLLEATKRAGKIPKVVKTDRLSSYTDGLERAFGSEAPEHIQSKGFASATNTNLVERLQGTIRSRVKVLRGLRTLETAQRWIEAYRVYYNYFRPHESLGGKTPAEAAGIRFPFSNWKEVVESQAFPTRKEYEGKLEKGITEGQPPQPIKVSRQHTRQTSRVKRRERASYRPALSRLGRING
jgi:transposase-like protein